MYIALHSHQEYPDPTEVCNIHLHTYISPSEHVAGKHDVNED